MAVRVKVRQPYQPSRAPERGFVGLDTPRAQRIQAVVNWTLFTSLAHGGGKKNCTHLL